MILPLLTSSSHDEYSLKNINILMGSRDQDVPEDGQQSLTAPPSASLLDQDATSTPRFVYVLAFFSALGGFLFGYDTGVVSGAMLLLKTEMNLNTLWQELLVSSTVGAAAISALSGGFLNGWFGRRICILLASFIFSAGGVILSVAPNKEVLLVGRITVGLGIGELFYAPLFNLCIFYFEGWCKDWLSRSEFSRNFVCIIKSDNI